jgi:regulatory protein
MDNKISKIENQKKNNERVNIYIDGEYAFSCSLEVVINNKLATGISVDSLQLSSIIEEDNYIKCKGYAFRVIERGLKSEKEMLNKLKDKGFDSKTCDRVINLLKEYEYIDDRKLSNAYISQKLKSEGSNKIKSFLYRKGIPESIIKEKISGINEDMEEKTAFDLAVKKYKILLNAETDNKKLYKKIGDYLIRKGYSYEISKRVLNRIFKEAYGGE